MNLFTLRWRATRFLARYPILFFPSIRIWQRVQGENNQPLLTRKGTEFVIEGYFRSANTFAVYAFLMAQPRWVVTAHHTHAPATIISAVQQSLPVLLLIREPIGTALSLALKHPGLTVEEGLKGYLNFYRRVLPYRKSLVVATFEQTIGDFGPVIERVNRRFETEYVPFQHTETNVQAIFAKIRASDSVVESGERAKYSVPLEEKEIRKQMLQVQLLQPRLKPLLEEARAIYDRFRRLS